MADAEGTAAAAPVFPPSGWIFSSDLSSEQQNEVNNLIAANGLSNGATEDDAERTAAADAAFLKLVRHEILRGVRVAAHPNATIVGPPTSSSEPYEATAAERAALRDVIAKHPEAIVLRPPAGDDGAEDGGLWKPANGEEAAAAEAAFATLVAANPGAKELAPGVFGVPREEYDK